MSQRVKRKHSVSSELPAALLVTHTYGPADAAKLDDVSKSQRRGG